MDKKGRPRLSFLKKHGLDHSSLPLEFFAALLPDLVINNWATFTNNKAILANAGQKGLPYPDWTPFKCAEIKQHIGVQILHGICLSPRLEMNLRPQSLNPVNGNYLVYRSMGPNSFNLVPRKASG